LHLLVETSDEGKQILPNPLIHHRGALAIL